MVADAEDGQGNLSNLNIIVNKNIHFEFYSHNRKGIKRSMTEIVIMS